MEESGTPGGGRERFPTPRERRTFRPQRPERLRDDLCKQGFSENKHPRVIFAEGWVAAGQNGVGEGGAFVGELRCLFPNLLDESHQRRGEM